MPDAPSITLRPVRPDDEMLLYTLYASTREEELALVDWDASAKEAFLRMQFTAQQNHYQGFFSQGDHQVILLHDRPIGRIYVSRTDEETRLVDITLLPEYRNRGIGTSLLRGLMDEAAKAGRPVRLHVFQYNHGALRLYERLGFARVGETGLHFFMEWLPK